MMNSLLQSAFHWGSLGRSLYTIAWSPSRWLNIKFGQDLESMTVTHFCDISGKFWSFYELLWSRCDRDFLRMRNLSIICHLFIYPRGFFSTMRQSSCPSAAVLLTIKCLRFGSHEHFRYVGLFKPEISCALSMAVMWAYISIVENKSGHQNELVLCPSSTSQYPHPL